MSLVKTVSRAIRVDGLTAVGGEAGQTVHETFQALSGFCQIGLCAPQTRQSYGVGVICTMTPKDSINGCLS